MYAAPGFMDGHIHVESSMVTVSGFTRAVVPCGTTAIFMDPHEIANVLGLDGVLLMHREGQEMPLRVFTTIPSCVPAAPLLEDAGAVITAADVKQAIAWDGIAGLGEMMNFPGVLAHDEDVLAIIREALMAGKPVTGHFALPDNGRALQAYIAAGASSCHESVRHEDALAKMRLGMYAMLREGSAWKDVKETIRAVTEHRIDSSLCILCSDDTHPETLLRSGHLDNVVRRAVEEGLNPVRAVQMVTINVARYFRQEAELGGIAPGKFADILLLSDLSRVKVERVLVAGVQVAEKGRLQVDLPNREYPVSARHSVNLGKTLAAEDFCVRVPAGAGKKHVKINVIKIEEAQAGTKKEVVSVAVQNSEIKADPGGDLAKVAVLERHKASGSYSVGFVSGFGLTRGAVASTVAHDSHNLIILGTNDQDMALAGNILAEKNGGMVAVADGEVLALVELPIAGLMSDRPVEEVAAAVAVLGEAWRKLGCTLVSPFMTLSLLSLPVIPELRLTNRGLVDVSAFSFTHLFVDEEDRAMAD
jgi:adenine deaminase